MCSCGPRCPFHYRNDQRKAYWLEINLNFVHSCSRNMYDFNFIPCVAWNVGGGGRKLSLPKVRHLRSPYPPSYFAEFHPAGHPPPLYSLLETNLGYPMLAPEVPKYIGFHLTFIKIYRSRNFNLKCRKGEFLWSKLILRDILLKIKI